MRYRLNRNVQILDLGDYSIVANGFLLQRSIILKEVGDLLKRFSGEGLEPEKFHSKSESGSRVARQLFDYFKARQFIPSIGEPDSMA